MISVLLFQGGVILPYLVNRISLVNRDLRLFISENAEVESRGVQVSVDGVDGVGLAKKVENMHVGQGKDEIDAVRSAESDFSKTVHSAADFLIAYATPEGIDIITRHYAHRK